jgi:hypothetical protein
MHVNGAGFITTVGGFSGTIDFDPNAGVNNLISAGSGDVFIARYNANGVYVWAYRIGDVNFDGARQIAVDASGFIYTLLDVFKVPLILIIQPAHKQSFNPIRNYLRNVYP